MVVISKNTLDEFSAIHTISAEPLNEWYKITKRANWSDFHDVKNTFNSVDAVGNDRFVFNIKGNDFRLIALILFRVRTIYILWLGTHADYDKMNKHTGANKVGYKK